MEAIKLDNGKLLIPMRAEGDNGLIGDGFIEIDADHPDYGEWLDSISEQSATSHSSANPQ